MTDNLPEAMHAPRTTAVTPATQVGGTDYDLDGQDIRLPRAKVGQKQSPAVNDKLADYGDFFVQRSKDDAEPTILQRNGELALGQMSDPSRFYVHGVRRGVNYKDPDNPDAGPNGMVLGPWGCSLLEFIQNNPGIDPVGVYKKYDYTITLPNYPSLPVAFLLASSWGGAAASELNTMIQLQRSQGTDVSTLAFRVQFKPVRHTKGDFMKAFTGLSAVSAKDKASDLEVVEQHKLLLPSAVIDPPDDVDSPSPSAAPSIA